ncbi:MAG: hypothetical protein SOW31_02365 [Treponema sp.]|nr:hypothetical protein [Treponema sp.]MDY3130549.1 hypothetical protein [Treponema sp.]
MKENIKNIGEQLPKMAGAEKKNSQKGSKGGNYRFLAALSV